MAEEAIFTWSFNFIAFMIAVLYLAAELVAELRRFLAGCKHRYGVIST
jgi:hypothetical protein